MPLVSKNNLSGKNSISINFDQKMTVLNLLMFLQFLFYFEIINCLNFFLIIYLPPLDCKSQFFNSKIENE